MKRDFVFSLSWSLAVLGAILFLFQSAHGHTLQSSTLTLVADARYLHLGLAINPFELSFFSELDANRDGRLDVDEWTGQGESIARRILGALELRVDGQPVVADLAGLAQSYESHHIVVRAHFPVRALAARVSVESRLATLTSESHVTEVEFGNGERAQTTRLGLSLGSVTFEPIEAATPPATGLVGGSADRAFQSFNASKANETAVMVLLGLLLLAGVPPAFFCILFRRHRGHPHPVPALQARLAAGIR